MALAHVPDRRAFTQSYRAQTAGGKTGLSKAMIVPGTQPADCLWRHASIDEASDGAALRAAMKAT
jgi:hypothetical protein